MIIKSLFNIMFKDFFCLKLKKLGGNMRKKSFLLVLILLFLTSCKSDNKKQVVVFNAGEYLDLDVYKVISIFK